MKIVGTDFNGNEVRLGDKVKGEGFLNCNDGYRIDLSPVVTVKEHNGIIYFGSLSMQSFWKFFKVEQGDKKTYT